MENPHLSENGIDFATGVHHCASCQKPVFHKTGRKLADAYFTGTWTHYKWVDVPEVLAKDPKTGHTLEGVVAVPARRVLVPASAQTGLSFCKDCWQPIKWNHFEHHPIDKCPMCEKVVDVDDEHTEADLLFHLPHHQWAARLRFCKSCLHDAFDKIKD
jgi:hypothetical protein